jgi:carboxylesterase type B
VKLTSGQIGGKKLLSRGGRDFYSFEGIPYAQPPVGELRFELPVPVAPWEGVLNTTHIRDVCIQWELDDEIAGSEDCLFLNVYSPKLPGIGSAPKLPVLFWLHGGSYTIGGGSFYLFSGFMDRDVVVVSINYRLGPFGFLSTGDEHLPGNYGMWDQVAALNWVQENIEKFGGDKNRVVAVGNSAGAASAILHLLSPASKGLIHGAVAHSGTPICPWAYQENPLSFAKKLAADLNCPTSSQELAECIKKLDAEDVITASHKHVSGVFYPIHYAPVVEKETVAKRFLPDHPIVLLETNQIVNRVPVMTGVTSNEGIIWYNRINLDVEFDQNFMDNKFDAFMRLISDFDGNIPSLSDVVKGLYLSHVDFNNQSEVRKMISEIAGDATFYAGNDETIKLLDRYGLPVYSFVFAHEGNFSLMDILGGTRDGVCHVDDLFYLFDFLPVKYSLNEQDLVTSERMIAMWTNFITKGVPTLEVTQETPVMWERYSSKKPNYLLIDRELSMQTGRFRMEQAELWNSVLPQVDVISSFEKDEL